MVSLSSVIPHLSVSCYALHALPVSCHVLHVLLVAARRGGGEETERGREQEVYGAGRSGRIRRSPQTDVVFIFFSLIFLLP
jgi:hypothetical protein